MASYVGLRGAVWVPLENGTFSIVKIVLLLALATSLPHTGIFISWMVPIAISVPLVNAFIFVRLMQPHARLTATRTPPSARRIGRFLASDLRRGSVRPSRNIHGAGRRSGEGRAECERLFLFGVAGGHNAGPAVGQHGHIANSGGLV